MIGIIDYGMGNLRSVEKALHHVGADSAEIIRLPEQVEAADKLVLPGVGAFADAMAHLHQRDLVEPILQAVRAGKWMLGICLGLQLLFEWSEEDGEHAGLALVPGRVVRFDLADPTLKIPHMGWNRIDPVQSSLSLFDGLPPAPQVYFVHSYYAKPTDPAMVAATADYPEPFCAAIARDNLWATQFHPEKSQQVGLKMLANFSAM